MGQRTLNRRSRREESEEDQYDERDNTTDDDEPAPRGRRGRSRRDDEDEAPRGRRSSRSSRRDPDEDDEPRSARSSRRSRSDDDEREPRVRNSGKGWGGYKTKRAEAPSGDFAKNYQLPEDQEEIIKILDEEPFSVVNEHWVDEMPKGKKKSYICIGKNCPLCNIGHKAKTYIFLNVVDMREGQDPKVAPWKVSSMTTEILEGFAESSRTSPINREDLYFSIQKTGGGSKGRVSVNVRPVKERDLKEDWDLEPLSDEELDEFELLTEDDVVFFSSRSELKDVADYLDS